MWTFIKKPFLYVLGVIPGLIQAHLNAPYRGALYFVLFCLFFNTAVMSRFWISDAKLQMMSIIVSSMAALVVWCLSYRDLIERLRNTTDPADNGDDGKNDPAC